MKNLVLAIAIFITCAGFAQGKNEFSLSGKTKDIPDGTMLLLQDPLQNIFIDSVSVKNNSFVLTTKLADYPYLIILYKDSSTAKMLWAEKTKMTFDATGAKFQEATITGSVTDSLVTQLRKRSRELKSYEEIVAVEREFITNNPNTIVSTHNLSVMASVFGKAQSKELFDKMPSKNKQSPYGETIAAYIHSDIPETPKVGERFADFTMKDQNGTEKKLSGFEGKVVLLEFWASWCVPCRKENPELVKTYTDFKQDGFEIVAVSLDDNKKNWLNAIVKDNLTWKHLSDLKGRNNIAALTYGVTGIPDNILIDKNGIIAGRNVHGETLNTKLSELLAVPNVEITQNVNSVKFKIKNTVIWQDENGKELSKEEVQAMLENNKYTPQLDTGKNIMVLKKT